MSVCDAHGAVHGYGSGKEMKEGEGYLLAAKCVQRSVIQEKMIDQDMPYIKDALGLTREEYRPQIDSRQGSSPWLICDDCVGLLNLSQEDLKAARESAIKWWRDKATPGHMPRSPAGGRDKRPAFIRIYGYGFLPSRGEAKTIFDAWVEKRKSLLGEKVGWDVRCEVEEFQSRNDLGVFGFSKSFLGLKSELMKQLPGHLIDDILIVDKRSGFAKHIALFAIWPPGDAEFIEGLLKTSSAERNKDSNAIPKEVAKPGAQGKASSEGIGSAAEKRPHSLGGPVGPLLVLLLFLLAMGPVFFWDQIAGVFGAKKHENSSLRVPEKVSFYRDSNGYFAALPPSGWAIQNYASEAIRSKVAFRYPTEEGFNIQINAGSKDYVLTAHWRGNENKIEVYFKREFPDGSYHIEGEARGGYAAVTQSGSYHIKAGARGGYDAVTQRFSAPFYGEEETVFLVQGQVFYSIALKAPDKKLFKNNSDLFNDFLRRFVLLDPAKEYTEQDIRDSLVAKYKRLVELHEKLGQQEKARCFVREALEIDQNNEDLKAIEERLSSRE